MTRPTRRPSGRRLQLCDLTLPLDIRPATESDAAELADLIHASTNHWYATHGMGTIFSGPPPSTTTLFFEVYEALDPGCSLVAVHAETGGLVGSCFYHRARRICLSGS